MGKITGYGRGWQEPLAKTRWSRFTQRARAPATKTDYLVVLGVGFPLLLFGMLFVLGRFL